MFKCRYVWLQSPQPWLLGDITELFPQNSVEQMDIQPFQTKPERVPIEWSSSSPDQRGEKSPPDCRAPSSLQGILAQPQGGWIRF